MARNFGDNGRVADLEFRRDLYRGTARYYDRFRVPYPQSLIDDLAERSGAAGEGRLLDLACGTGQLGFALHGRFEEVWAVDQEPGMVGVAREKAEAAGIGNIRFLTSAAEELSAPEESFDLVAIGNAFHRLRREATAANAFRWLRPGGFLALAWGGTPWEGKAPWQKAMSATLEQWMTRVEAHGRIPPEYGRVRREHPDLAILHESGFRLVGYYQFPAACEWTPEALTGFVFSTSVLSREALGGLAPDFEEDLRRVLHACEPTGRLPQITGFAYDLARRPV
jgi:ubiquinone/menaquinone biosynthesis C-methylase UbiE